MVVFRRASELSRICLLLIRVSYKLDNLVNAELFQEPLKHSLIFLLFFSTPFSFSTSDSFFCSEPISLFYTLRHFAHLLGNIVLDGKIKFLMQPRLQS